MTISTEDRLVEFFGKAGKRSWQGGFSLVEILVGMVVALLASLAIMQAFSGFEGQKRITSGTADAQTSSALAIYSIQREVQQAGFGMALYDYRENRLLPMDCPSIVNITGDSSISPAPVDYVPVVIADGENDASDEIVIRYGNSPTGGAIVEVTAVSGGGSALSVNNNMVCRVNDQMLITDRGNNRCFLGKVEGLDDTTGIDLVQGNGSIAASTSSAPVHLSCFEPVTPRSFAAVGGELRLNDDPIAADIVGLQAQYGIAAENPAVGSENQVVAWVNATDEWAAGAIDMARRKRIKAVRVAVIARNPLYQKEVVSQACSAENAPEPTGLCAWAGMEDSPAPKVDLAALTGLEDWDHYRYRIFETIIPLRNVVWAKEAM